MNPNLNPWQTYQEGEEELEEHLDDGRHVGEGLRADDEGCQEESTHEPLAVLRARGGHDQEEGSSHRIPAVEHALVTGHCGDVVYDGRQVVVAYLVQAVTQVRVVKKKPCIASNVQGDHKIIVWFR